MALSAALKEYIAHKKLRYELSERDFVHSHSVYPSRGYPGGINHLSGDEADRQNMEILRDW